MGVEVLVEVAVAVAVAAVDGWMPDSSPVDMIHGVAGTPSP